MTLKNQEIRDLAIIGGGIAGAGIARDAVMRGASVILFEKSRFGSGTSSKTSKLIHGGIRYLETAWCALKRLDLKEAWKNFRFVFLALRETHILERIAPKLVHPIPLIIPIYKNGGRNIWAVRLGALLYGFMAVLSGSRRLPAILWGPKAVLKYLPELNSRGLAGGVIIWDHQTQDQKLVEATMQAARKAGAEAMENTEVLGYRYDETGGVYEIEVGRDAQRQIYRARKLINAGGPWSDTIRRRGGETGENWIIPVAGSHIEMKKIISHSVILQAADERIFFVINRGGISRIGTTEWRSQTPEIAHTPKTDVAYLLDSLRFYFPGLQLGEDAIINRDSGVRPLAKPRKDTEASRISREHEVRVGTTGVWHVLGVKLTDHRRAAEEIMDRLVPEMRPFNPGLLSRTQTDKKRLDAS